jgi:hypothetical protein
LSPLPSTSKQSSLTININKQTIISHHYNQQTNNHLSLLTSLTNNPLTITINKQTIISHHYHQQTNNHLSPLTPTIVCLLMIMVRDDCLFVDGNGER